MIKAQVRGKYKALSRQELLDKAYELGYNCEINSQNCCQCTVATFRELLGIDDVVVRVATSNEGGQADQVIGTCGGLIGGTMVLDYFFGRPVEYVSFHKHVKANMKRAEDAVQVAKLLYDKYINEYGTILCPHLQVQLFGRHYYPVDPDDLVKFEKAGGHEDKCPSIVGSASRWVMEILLGKGAVEL